MRRRLLALVRPLLRRIASSRPTLALVHFALRLMGPAAVAEIAPRVIARAIHPGTTLDKCRLARDAAALERGDHQTVTYAEQVFAGQVEMIERFTGAGVTSRRVLELGPGFSLIPGLLHYVHGARQYVAVDVHPIACDASEVYAFVRAELGRRAGLIPLEGGHAAREAVLRRFDEAADLSSERVRLMPGAVDFRCPVDAARLPFEDASFDLVLSNAVLEHVADPAAVVRENARVLAPGGWAFHQIDLRDHRDSSRPLDFLEIGPEEWADLGRRPEGLFPHTNRFRKGDFARSFVESGVEIVRAEPNLRVEVSPEQRADSTRSSGIGPSRTSKFSRSSS